MKIKQFLAPCAITLLAACSGPPTPPVSKKTPEIRAHKVEERKAASAANNISAYQRELALRISEINASLVYAERPQALLRSVIVLRYHLNADGKLIRSEIVRSNHDKNTETIALASIGRASPFPKPAPHLLRNGKLEITETWLFNNDGRFQLRTIALPQMSE